VRRIAAAHGGRLELGESALPPGRSGSPGARLALLLPGSA
jgi:hypothetical protein